MIRYTLRLFGRLVAEFTVESNSFEVTIEPGVEVEPEPKPEPLRWFSDDSTL